MKKSSGANKLVENPKKQGLKLFVNRNQESAEKVSVKDICRVLDECGACALLRSPYREQLQKKTTHLKELLGQAGLNPNQSECHPSIHPLAYRHVAKLVVSEGKHPDPQKRWILIGLYQPGSHHVTDIGSCPVQTERINQVLSYLRSALSASQIPIYDPKLKKPGLRYIIIKESHKYKNCLLTFVGSLDDKNALRPLARELQQRLTHVKGVLFHLNRSEGNEIFGSNGTDASAHMTQLLCGVDFLDDTIGDLKIRFRPESFTQVNPDTAARMYRRLIELLAPQKQENHLDLYSGIGSITLSMASHVNRSIGIEENSLAVSDAQANAQLNGMKNVTFLSGRAEDLITKQKLNSIHLVTLNPSRRGADPLVLKSIAAQKPRAIGYMSCHAESLMRDAKRLRELGYELRLTESFDMFPGTPHYETIAIFTP